MLVAEGFSFTRSEGIYPGWHFAVEELKPLPPTSILRRLAIWKEFADRNLKDTPVKVSWYQGLKVNLRLGNDQSRCLYVGGSFDPNELWYLGETLKPGMCFVDVGANEGFYTMYAARKVGSLGRVFSFEPSYRERSWLERNVRTNQLTNVQVLPLALADAKGNAVLNLADAEHNGQNTLGSFGHKGVACVESVEVELATLDDLRESGRIPKIDVIKIDVEGAELRVLKGARKTILSDRPVILMELFESALRGQGGDINQVVGFLQDLHYQLFEFALDTGHLTRLVNLSEPSTNVVAIPARLIHLYASHI